MQELVGLITEENGKTREEAQGSFDRGIECIEFACGAPTLMIGDRLTGLELRSIAGPLDIRSACAWALRRQFSHHGSAVDVSAGHCLWQYFYPEAIRQSSAHGRAHG